MSLSLSLSRSLHPSPSNPEQVVRTADSKDWTLHVKYAQPRDSGIYECQVNTEPKISMAFRLNVIGE